MHLLADKRNNGPYGLVRRSRVSLVWTLFLLSQNTDKPTGQCFTTAALFSFSVQLQLHLPNCFAQEAAKVSFDLRVKLAPAHLFTTHGGGFVLSLFMTKHEAGKPWIPIFMVFGLTENRTHLYRFGSKRSIRSITNQDFKFVEIVFKVASVWTRIK